MKKLIAIILACILTLSAMVVPASAMVFFFPEYKGESYDGETHLIATVNNAPIRNKAEKSGDVVGRCYVGQFFNCLEAFKNQKGNLWYKIRYNGDICYIYSGNVASHYENYKGTDVCDTCKHERLHVSLHDQLFVATTRFTDGAENVKSYSEPRKTSKEVSTYKELDRLTVTGRIRNELDELWLKLSNGSYINANEAAFDFEASANKAYEFVKSYSSNPDSLEWIKGMLEAFRDYGQYDLKIPSLLGANSKTSYHIYSNKKIQNKDLGGIELGNVQYGYVCNKFMISERRAVTFVGGDHWVNGRFIKAGQCVFSDVSYCDNQTGFDYVSLGYEVFRQSFRSYSWDWNFHHRSQFTSKLNG